MLSNRKTRHNSLGDKFPLFSDSICKVGTEIMM
jgi:hypothetical protein